MKRFFLSLLAFATLSGAVAQDVKIQNVEDPVEWVNTLMGTDSKFALSNGNTYPAVAVPWGMNFWTPQTAPMGDGWTYAHDADFIRGIKQTHQPSPWINDYGQFAFLPTTGARVFSEDDRKSWFSHKAETAKPYLYSVYLADHDVTVSLTPTTRAANVEIIYPQSDSSNLVIDAYDKASYVKVIKEENKIVGYTTRNSGGVPENFKNWFVIELDKDIESVEIWDNGKKIEGITEITSKHAGAVVSFKTKKGEKVAMKVASSFISLEQAQLNLDREVGRDNFAQTMGKAKERWNKELSRIEITDGQYQDIKTFYSCLYRVLLFPRKFYEFDKNNKIMHYSPYNGEVLPGYMFTDNGFWDTFRAVFPFFTLAYPELTSHIMEGLVNTYKESGWLPEWASPGHRDCMIGSNSASIVADAYLKGVRGFDIETLYEALIKNSENEGPLNSVARRGAHYYNKLGYVPYDVNIHENAARTLEYAYADFSIMRLAQELGKSQSDIDKFHKRAYNYRNLFDPEHKLMRGKNEDGTFQSPFNPLKWGDAFTEGNSWHYTWSVFQDVDGLIDLMGGRKEFVNMLDSVFTVPPTYDNSYYGFTIHEITEMVIANFGNYAHGNQPIQHLIYLYAYAGQPWKGQQRAREIMTKLYSPNPDGYCGDEDNGQTSAWYVFSSMGFYPAAPTTGEYIIGSPMFGSVKLELENGKSFTVTAKNNSLENIYIQSATLNGKALDRAYLSHEEVAKGGELVFVMGDKPNKKWAASEESAPYSLSNFMPLK